MARANQSYGSGAATNGQMKEVERAPVVSTTSLKRGGVCSTRQSAQRGDLFCWQSSTTIQIALISG